MRVDRLFCSRTLPIISIPNAYWCATASAVLYSGSHLTLLGQVTSQIKLLR